MYQTIPLWALCCCALMVHPSPLVAHERGALWLDCYLGEVITFDKMVEDLATVDVVYCGERHTIARHHELQRQVVNALAATGKRVSLGLEQLEQFNQPHLDRYNAGDIDFDELARLTNWKKRWSNYADYRPPIEAAVRSGGRIVALNGRAELIRAIGRQGLAGLTDEQRRQLPRPTKLENDWHERLVKMKVMVHAAMKKDMLDSIYAAQAMRDECMAAATAKAVRQAQDDEIFVVLLGSGHCTYGLGTPQRVRARLPDHRDRILHFTESGDLVLSKKMKAMARDIEYRHEDMRFLQTPIADYIHCKEAKNDRAE